MSWIDLDPGLHDILAASLSDVDDEDFKDDDDDHDDVSDDDDDEDDDDDDDDDHDDGVDDHHRDDDEDVEDAEPPAAPVEDEEDGQQNDHEDVDHEVKAPGALRKRGRPRKAPSVDQRQPKKTKLVLQAGYTVNEFTNQCCNHRYIVTV